VSVVGPVNKPLLLQFGPFKLDLQAFQLFKGETLIHLPPQPCKVLALLASNPHKVFTRQEIRCEIWGDETFVDFDQGLNAAIRQIRAALCDDAETPRYIETLPRRGYRFISQVDGHSAAAEGAMTPVPLESATISALSAPRPASSRRPMTVLVGLALVVVAVVLVWRRERIPARTPRAHVQSLAVLPLENLSHDPDQEYFSDGMTDAVITDLAQIGALKVISRTSVMHYKKTDKTLPEIARELNVDAIVEGAVARDANHVRITAQLVDARTDQHLWAQSYEGDLRDVLRLQDQVALAIVKEIKVKLSPQQQARLQSASAVSPEAHELYLRGRFHWNKRTEEGLKKSIEYFQQAIERDPTYSLAYSGLADSYNMLGLYGVFPQIEVIPKAKAAATKALEIDEQFAEPHASLAWTKFAFDWDWAGAEREFKRAIELNPGYETAHRWMANCLTQQGRLDEALAEIKRAEDLDPLSLVNNDVLGYNLYFLGNYDQAIEQERKTLELDNFALAHFVLGLAYEQKGNLEQAIIEFQKATTLDTNPIYPAGLGHAFASAGRRREARKLLRDLIKLSKQRDIAWNEIAVIHAGLHENDQALAALETAYRKHSSQLNWLKVDPRFDSLHNDPRFQALLRQMNLQL
jgi:TolB-like protein/DNA-binding winged helix-turn-helix (wHTH) protein/Flp pilus assembly protein TadD